MHTRWTRYDGGGKGWRLLQAATAAGAAGGDGGGGAGRPPPEGIIGQAGSRVGMTPARAPSCYICGRRQLAAVRSSCAFRAALPASRTNRRCGRCVYGGECARHERRLSRVRDIKFLEGGTIRARPAPAVSWCRAGVAGERARTWRASMGPTERSPVNERAGWHDEWVE